MLVKIEARILIFPGTDFHFPSTSVPPGTFLGSGGGIKQEVDGVDSKRVGMPRGRTHAQTNGQLEKIIPLTQSIGYGRRHAYCISQKS